MEIRSIAKNFIDTLDKIETNQLKKGIKSLTKSEKEFVIYCSNIINNKSEEIEVDKSNFKKINRLSNKIIKKISNAKESQKTSLITRFFKKILNLTGLRTSRNDVIQAIKGQPLNQTAFKQVLHELKAYKDLHPDETIIFGDFLKERGFSTDLKGLNFRINDLVVKEQKGIGKPPAWSTDLFRDVNFSNIHFTDCDFTCVSFRGSNLTSCTFDHCYLEQSVFYQTTLLSTSFHHSSLRDSFFDHSTLSDVQFNHCPLNYSSFYKTKMENVDYDSCQMEGANFLGTLVANSRFKDSFMENCLLFESKQDFQIDGGTEHKITKPIVGLPWSIPLPGVTASRVYKHLKTQGSIPMRVNYSPPKVDSKALADEVSNQMRDIQAHPDRDKLSIPSAILESVKENPQDNPTISKLREEAKLIASHTNAILLPGGADIQPEFYGAETDSKTHVDKHYKRSIFEFSLIDESRQRGLPLMGICRGSQMGNIFFGGQVEQHVDGQLFAIQSYQARPPKKGEAQGIIRQILDNHSFKGLSAHHQANKNVSKKHFEEVITYQGIPKAFEGKQGAPMIFTQFHPEFKSDQSSFIAGFISFLLSKRNDEFFNAFIDSANTHRKKVELNQRINLLGSQKQKRDALKNV